LLIILACISISAILCLDKAAIKIRLKSDVYVGVPITPNAFQLADIITINKIAIFCAQSERSIFHFLGLRVNPVK